MREAIGGTWLLGFVVLFIVLFSAYLAISINYTKAFRVKNQIINIIEENEGFTMSVGDVSGKPLDQLQDSSITEEKVYYYLKNIGYATTKINEDRCPGNPDDMMQGGYCVRKICTPQGAYYKVTSFIKIELPFIWRSFVIPISGETKVLYYTNDDSDMECR